MTSKNVSEEEKLREKWQEGWSEDWQWMISAIAKEMENPKLAKKEKILNEFYQKFLFYTEKEENIHYSKRGSQESKCVVNKFIGKNNKTEFRTLNYDKIGKKAKLITLAHGSKAGVDAYLKSFSCKLTKDEGVDVRHKFFTDSLLTIQPSSTERKSGGKEEYFCTVQSASGQAYFRLIKKYDKKGEPYGRLCEYHELNLHGCASNKTSSTIITR